MSNNLGILRITEYDLLSMPIVEGNYYYCTDSRKLYSDSNGTRLIVTPIINVNTEVDRQYNVTPSFGTFYYVLETNELWLFNGKWTVIVGTAQKYNGYYYTQEGSLAGADATYVTDNNGLLRDGSVVVRDINRLIKGKFYIDATIGNPENTNDLVISSIAGGGIKMVPNGEIDGSGTLTVLSAGTYVPDPEGGDPIVLDAAKVVLNEGDFYVRKDGVDYILSTGGDVENKMDKHNPTGTGSLSINRKANTTIGNNSSAVGKDGTASGNSSSASGFETTASGNYSNAGNYKTVASSNYSHAEGYKSVAAGSASHAEGNETTANTDGSHAEGYRTSATGQGSHAEGSENTANGTSAHVEGRHTEATATAAHAEGYYTKATANYQHVQGKYNATGSSFAFIIGNGSDDEHRSNALTVDWQGNLIAAGNVTDGNGDSIASVLVALSNKTLASLSGVSIDSATLVDGQVLKYDAEHQVWYNGTGGGGTGGGHVIENAAGSSLTQRDILQFAGYLKATDDDINEVTVVDDSPTEITYADWLLLTPEEKAGVKWLITDAPGGEGSGDATSIDGIPVTITDPTDKQLIGYDANTGELINMDAPSAGLLPHFIILSDEGSDVTVVGPAPSTDEIIPEQITTEQWECDVPNYGSYTIHSVLNGEDKQTVVNVTTCGKYTIDDSHMHASIIVTYPTGATVSCSMTGAPTQYATESPYTFIVHNYGVWRITGTRNGVTEIHDVTIYENGQEEEVTLSLIPEGSTVMPTDDIQLWLACAGIEDKPYTMLQQVLADSATLLKVLTNDNASDYLARSTTWATGITADSNAMAIIGSYDYCANALLDSGSTWAEAIVNSAYNTSVANVSVPQMTSDTTPKGICYADYTYSSSYKYRAFDKDASTYWTAGQSVNHYIGYEFTKAVKILGAKVTTNNYSQTFSIRGDLTDTLHASVTQDASTTETYLLDSTNRHTKFDLYITASGSGWTTINELDFLGRENGGAQSWLKAGGIQKSYTQLSQILGDTATLRDLMASKDAVDYLVTAKAFIDDICANQTAMSLIGANDYAADTLLADEEWATAIANSTYKDSVIGTSVPTMTSATTPSGEVFANTYASSYYPWYAFGNKTTEAQCWATSGDQTGVGYIGYDFGRAVKIVAVMWRNRNSTQANRPLQVGTIQGSNDGTTWVDIADVTTQSLTYNAVTNGSFANNSAYSRYRILAKTPSDTQGLNMQAVQFYGRETGGVQTWLHSAGIANKNYTTIAEIANDPDTLIALITNNDAVDYLVTAKALIDDIVANETIMQAIGSYDYCADSLLADSEWCNAIQNSTYFASVDNAKVPIMTSNTTPRGEVSASLDLSSFRAYFAFDRNTATKWVQENGTTPYIQYKFASAIRLLKFMWQGNQDGSAYPPTQIVVKASNDGSTYTTLETISSVSADKNEHYQNIDSVNEYDYFRLDVTNRSGYSQFAELQFYGRTIGGIQSWLRAGNITDKTYTTLAEVLTDSTTLLALIANHNAVDYLVTAKGLIDEIVADATAMSYIGLNNYCANTLLADMDWRNSIINSPYIDSVMNVQVPTMTSATTPSGVVTQVGLYSDRYAWRLFDKNTSTDWTTEATGHFSAGNSFKYEFPTEVTIYGLKYWHNTADGTTAYPVNVEGSTDDSTFNLLKTFTETLDNNYHMVTFDNFSSNKWYRWTYTGPTRSGLCEVQFYGRVDV